MGQQSSGINRNKTEEERHLQVGVGVALVIIVLVGVAFDFILHFAGAFFPLMIINFLIPGEEILKN